MTTTIRRVFDSVVITSLIQTQHPLWFYHDKAEVGESSTRSRRIFRFDHDECKLESLIQFGHDEGGNLRAFNSATTISPIQPSWRQVREASIPLQWPLWFDHSSLFDSAMMMSSQRVFNWAVATSPILPWQRRVAESSIRLRWPF